MLNGVLIDLLNLLTMVLFPLLLLADLSIEHFAFYVLEEVDKCPKASEQDDADSNSNYCLWNCFVLSLLFDLVQHISEHNIAEHPQQCPLRPK